MNKKISTKWLFSTIFRENNHFVDISEGRRRDSEEMKTAANDVREQMTKDPQDAA